jgi:hypothetical protein
MEFSLGFDEGHMATAHGRGRALYSYSNGETPRDGAVIPAPSCRRTMESLSASADAGIHQLLPVDP